MIKTFTITFVDTFFADQNALYFVKDLKSMCSSLNLGVKWKVKYWNLPLIRTCWVKVGFVVEGEDSSVLTLEEWKKDYKKNDKDLYYDKYSGESLKSGYVERK